MNREEAAREIDNTACCFSDKRFRDAMHMAAAALRGPQPDTDTGLKGCWHCRNIEAHHIEYVIAVKAKGGTPMNTPVDCPYHYCPACGRKLEVGE